MNKNTYYIPSTKEHPLAVAGELVECSKCRRKILVNMGLIGISHTVNITVDCLDCLEVNATFREKFPDIAKQIDDWK